MKERSSAPQFHMLQFSTVIMLGLRHFSRLSRNNIGRLLLTNDYSKKRNNYNRVLNLIADVVNAQAKTVQQMAKTDQQMAKTDQQLRSLISYNRNRDQELELTIEETLNKALRDEEWTVSKVGFLKSSVQMAVSFLSGTV
jgi:23S rRNA A1618 N6-methylase RlmF